MLIALNIHVSTRLIELLKTKYTTIIFIIIFYLLESNLLASK